MGIYALYLGPLFEPAAHGYDTADFFTVDRRLGTNGLLTELMATLHQQQIRVIVDGVFHHVGRAFWAFQDVLTKGPTSTYADWVAGIDFSRRSPYIVKAGIPTSG